MAGVLLNVIERLDESTVNEGEWSKVRTLHIGTSDSGSGSTDESEEAGAVAADEPATEEPAPEHKDPELVR